MTNLSHDTAQIIKIMRRDLHFEVTAESVLQDDAHADTNIHIRIDADRERFYLDFFIICRRQMQLLNALGDTGGAAHVVAMMKTDLSRIIKTATHSPREIVFHIPQLEQFISPNA